MRSDLAIDAAWFGERAVATVKWSSSATATILRKLTIDQPGRSWNPQDW